MFCFKVVFSPSFIFLGILLLLNCLQGACFPTEVKIGGIFCKDMDLTTKRAFLLGIEYINNSTSILPNVQLLAEINDTDWLDSFNNIEAVYWQIYKGVAAIIGPMTSSMVKITYPLCEGFGVPQIAPYATDPSFEFSSHFYTYLLRMSSSDSIENQVIGDFISHFNWTRLALISSRSEYGLNGLVTLKDIASHKGWQILAYETFQEHKNISLINATNQLIHIRSRGARIIILKCLAAYIPTILKQARELGVLKDRVWILTSGAFGHESIHTPGIAVPDYLQGIVGIRHTFGRGQMSATFKTAWKSVGYPETSFGNEAVAGHTFDAVLVLAEGLQKLLDNGYSISNVTQKFGLYTNSETTPRPEGKYLMEYLSKVNTSGVMSDNLVFDSSRSPVEDEFDVVNLRSYGFEKVAHWNPNERLVMEANREIVWPSGKVDIPSDSTHLIENRTLKVVTIEEHPFIYVFTSEKDGKKQYKFSGYCIELLEKLAEKMKFNYEIYPVSDDQFGSVDALTKEWNGMVKELLQGKADLAVASFTISPERQRVIDFTQPYISLGLTALIKSVSKTSDYFSFFRPFRNDMWAAIGVTMIVVGFFLWFFSTFSPYGYYGRCVQTCLSRVHPEYLKFRDTLTLVRALWSSVVYYVGQSSDHLHPVSSSGRITVAVWWFAILIIMSSYTANLAAFLTIQRFSSPIKTVSELAQQKSISYGTVQNSQPQAFFETSTIPSFVTMWQYMQYHHTFVKSSAEGIQKAKDENYAFIWDSVVLEYITHQQSDCGSLTTVGSLLGKIGYGFGLQKDSPYTQQLSNAILELRHKGVMDILEKKWIHSNERCSGKPGSGTTEDGTQLGLGDLAGVFIVVCAGIASSFVVLACEWLWAARKDTEEKEKDTGSKPSLITALHARRIRAFHDWRHREDIPKVRKNATLMWNTVRPMLPTWQSRQPGPTGALTPNLDSSNVELDKIVSFTQTAEIEIEDDDDDDNQSYVV